MPSADLSQPLQQKLSAALASVPSGKRGWLSLGLSKQGPEASIGWKPRAGVTLSGYGVSLWNRSSWQGGIRGEFIW